MLEDILLSHDAVDDVGVIGIPDEEAGELPRAYIVKKPNKDTSATDLQNFVAGKMAAVDIKFTSQGFKSACGIARPSLEN